VAAACLGDGGGHGCRRPGIGRGRRISSRMQRERGLRTEGHYGQEPTGVATWAVCSAKMLAREGGSTPAQGCPTGPRSWRGASGAQTEERDGRGRSADLFLLRSTTDSARPASGRERLGPTERKPLTPAPYMRTAARRSASATPRLHRRYRGRGPRRADGVGRIAEVGGEVLAPRDAASPPRPSSGAGHALLYGGGGGHGLRPTLNTVSYHLI